MEMVTTKQKHLQDAIYDNATIGSTWLQPSAKHQMLADGKQHEDAASRQHAENGE
jgi:hypothetical protein